MIWGQQKFRWYTLEFAEKGRRAVLFLFPYPTIETDGGRRR
jgi:hypothetical protein